MKSLRTYQREAIDSLFDYWVLRGKDHLLIVAPTGSGKSLIIAKFLQEAFEDYPGTRVIAITHRKELIEQNYQELKDLWPEAPAGIYSAGLGRKEDQPILFAGIQSIYKKARSFAPFDLVIIDEAHLIPRGSDTQYGRFLSDIKTINEDAKFLGLTATPFRLDSGWLHKGEGAIFEDIAYDIPIQQLIDDGYLSHVTAKHSKSQIDLSRVKTRAGEYAEDDLEREAIKITNHVVREVCSLGENRKGWLIFTAGVKSAEEFQRQFEQAGIRTGLITGQTEDRSEIIERFKRQEIRCLVSVAVLTTGFNATHVDLIAMVRATKSPGLYVQICGRGMRLHPGKSDCLLLDYGSNVLRHGPLDDIRVKRKGEKGDGEAPLKVCKDCDSLVHLAAKECPDCGFVFNPPNCPKCGSPYGVDRICYGCRKEKAYRGALLKKDVEAQIYDVTHMDIRRHQKVGKPDSVRISYRCGMSYFNEWLCPEHAGYARKFYELWCSKAGIVPAPKTVNEFLRRQNEIRSVQKIKVIPNGKYFDIKGRKFADAQ